MRKVISLATIAAGTVLLAACGSTGNQTATPQASTKAPYLPIYNGIRSQLPAHIDSQKVDDGFPFIFPDVARILAPKRLEADITNTTKTSINGNYIGKNLKRNQRMAIYSAKMFLYVNYLAVPQYLNGALVHETAKAAQTALHELAVVGGPFYGAKEIPAQDLKDNNNPESLMGGLQNAGAVLGHWTGIAPIAAGTLTPVNNIPVAPDPNKNRACFEEVLKGGTVYTSYSNGTYGLEPNALKYYVCITPQPGEWSHVWHGITAYM